MRRWLGHVLLLAELSFITTIPPGAMKREMSIMITTLTNMEKIHGVIGIGQPENAIPFLVKRVLIATTTGSVRKDIV